MMEYVEALLPTLLNVVAVAASGAAIIISLRTFKNFRETEQIMAETRRILDEMERDQ